MNTLAILAATLLQLGSGYNEVGVAGEVCAVQAATSNATASVTIKAIDVLTVYTNLTQKVVSFEPAWALTYTNFDGEASVSTNVVGRLDLGYFSTNGVTKIIAGPTRFDMPTTNEVFVAKVEAETWYNTNTIATLTCAEHFGSVSTNAYLFGGGLLVEGADEGDKINILIK